MGCFYTAVIICLFAHLPVRRSAGDPSHCGNSFLMKAHSTSAHKLRTFIVKVEPGLLFCSFLFGNSFLFVSLIIRFFLRRLCLGFIC